jgi:2-methylcitrate dehydratase PrpD
MADMVYDFCKTYAKLKFSDFSPELIDTTKRFILDTIGCGYAGTSAPGYKEIHEIVGSFGGKEESSLLAFDEKLPSPDAAFINGVAFHALDFDETFDEASMHAYVAVLPAAMAVAEARGASGKDFITGVIAGIDLSCRLGAATLTPLSWIRTATCGSFGATAAAAKILNFNHQNMANAYGVVYSQTSGNMQCTLDRGLVKRMQPGFAARAGVLSVLMAELGITGAKDVFEGTYGYFNLYERGVYDRNKALEGLGEVFFGEKLSIKPYPSCRMTHAAIDAALYIKEKCPVDLGEIERIEFYVSKMSKEFVGKPFEVGENPQVNAQFSIPYLVGVAFTRGKPFINDINKDNVKDKKWMDITSKIDIYIDKDIHEKNTAVATINVKLKSGNILTHKVTSLKGSPKNPFGWNDCVDKFEKCARFAAKKLTDEQIDNIIENITNLENLTSGELNSFFSNI